MKKTPVEVQKRYNNMKREIKSIITGLRMSQDLSKINAKRSASYVVKKTCYSRIRTFRIYVSVLGIHVRMKQKDMLFEGENIPDDLYLKPRLCYDMYKYKHVPFLSE